MGRDKLGWLMQQPPQKEAASGREFPYFSHGLGKQLFQPVRNAIKSRSSTASAPFKHIAMRLTSLLSNHTEQRFKCNLTAIDVFTKGCAVRMTNKDRARFHAAFEQTLRKITRHGEERFGGMRRDNGSEMKSNYIKWCARDKGISHFFSSACTPQSKRHGIPLAF